MKKRKTIILFFFLLALFSAFLVLASIIPHPGFVEADLIKVSGNNLLIGKNCTAIVGVISAERASYIQDGLEGEVQIRPNIYDVFKETLNHYNITLDAVQLVNLRHNTYYAKSIFSKGNKILEVDCRPSDCISLAVRTNSTVYVNETLLKEQGRKVC